MAHLPLCNSASNVSAESSTCGSPSRYCSTCAVSTSHVWDEGTPSPPQSPLERAQQRIAATARRSCGARDTNAHARYLIFRLF